MLALRLPPELEARLTALAEKTGRTKSFYARAAIKEYIEDLEDYYPAEETMKTFKPGDAIPLEAVMKSLGLED
jgi:RHH-type rel operon transcriptional repressor/antitoxin RelB